MRKHTRSISNEFIDQFLQSPNHQSVSANTDWAGQEHVPQQTQPLPHKYAEQKYQSYMAGGDANLQQLKTKYGTKSKYLPSNRPKIRNECNGASDANYTESIPSSSRSGSTTHTTIEQSKKGKQLLKLTHSKANLMKTVDEGIRGTEPSRCSVSHVSGKHGQQSKDMARNKFSNPWPPSPSAGVINEKIIHPMIKKFRLLYLHNIKEEVSIMEDLEKLPHKLDEICRQIERD